VSVPVVLRPEAELDLLTARNWYDQQQDGLGDEFTAVIFVMNQLPRRRSILTEEGSG
jgi:hypothetical protein